MDPDTAWDGGRLREAMAATGEGPTGCSAALHKIDPECHPNKGSVIGWRDDRHQPHSRNRRALEIYIANARRPVEAATSLSEADASSDAQAFDRLMETVTVEPALQGRQAAFVDALIQALASGAFNEHYTATREQVSRIVGLGSTL